MQKWFECKVKYSKIDEQTGKDKTVSEPYLVDAMSFTEAESRINEKLNEFIHTDFVVVSFDSAEIGEITGVLHDDSFDPIDFIDPGNAFVDTGESTREDKAGNNND